MSSGRARAHSTYEESLSEDELQEFKQANGGKVLEKSGRNEEIRECCSSFGEEPNHRLHWKGLDPRWRWHRSLAATRAKRVS